MFANKEFFEQHRNEAENIFKKYNIEEVHLVFEKPNIFVYVKFLDSKDNANLAEDLADFLSKYDVLNNINVNNRIILAQEISLPKEAVPFIISKPTIKNSPTTLSRGMLFDKNNTNIVDEENIVKNFLETNPEILKIIKKNPDIISKVLKLIENQDKNSNKHRVIY